eukprot:SAG31_NODE_7490_length_1675_cov_1.281726_1_plen_233_part_00
MQPKRNSAATKCHACRLCAPRFLPPPHYHQDDPLAGFMVRTEGKGCYFLVFMQLFEKYGTLIERNTALIEKVSPCSRGLAARVRHPHQLHHVAALVSMGLDSGGGWDRRGRPEGPADGQGRFARKAARCAGPRGACASFVDRHPTLWLCLANRCTFVQGQADAEGIVWPRLAEISLLGALGCGRSLLGLALGEMEPALSPYSFAVLQATDNSIPFYERQVRDRMPEAASVTE